MSGLNDQFEALKAERNSYQHKVYEALKLLNNFYCETENDYFDLFQNLDLNDLMQINSAIKILNGDAA